MPRTSAKTKFNKSQIREALTEQLSRAVHTRGFVDKLFETLDQIKDPDKELRCAIELMKFVVPQLAAQKIEVEQTTGHVERVVFTPLTSSAVEDTEAKGA